MAAVSREDSKTPRSWGVTSRQLRSLCMLKSHVASQKPEKFHEKGIINHCIYQFQSLSIAIPESHELGIIPKKERWKQRSAYQPFTSHHSIPPQPWHHHTEATPRTESSRLHRTGSTGHNIAGILGIEVQSKAICLYSSVFVGVWKPMNIQYLPWWWWWWNSNIFKEDCHSSWSTYTILSQVSSFEITKLCLLNLVQTRQFGGATG